jgi:hypothetical protein
MAVAGQRNLTELRYALEFLQAQGGTVPTSGQPKMPGGTVILVLLCGEIRRMQMRESFSAAMERPLGNKACPNAAERI